MPCCVASKGETVPIDVLVAELNIYLPKVAAPIAKAAIMRGVMSVVDKAKLLEYTVSQDYYEGVTGYPIEIQGCSSILQIINVKLNGVDVGFEVIHSNWIELTSVGGVSYGGPCPESKQSVNQNALVADVYGGISVDACDVPLEIYQRYGQTIIYAALGTLYGMHGEEWYDAGLVKFYGGIAKGGVSDIKQDRFEQEVPDGIPLSTSGGLII